MINFNDKVYVGVMFNNTQDTNNVSEKQESSEEAEDSLPVHTATSPPLPPCLATKKAMTLWQKAQEAGYIDENYQPIITKTKAAILADYIGNKLQLTERWKPFEKFWQLENLNHNYYRAICTKQGGTFIDTLLKSMS